MAVSAKKIKEGKVKAPPSPATGQRRRSNPLPSNDEVVWGIPSIQCPSCGHLLDISGPKLEKFSKAQRKAFGEETNQQSSGSYRQPAAEDLPSTRAENTYVTVTCGNHYCEQYNKFKVLKLPRIHTPSVKVEL